MTAVNPLPVGERLRALIPRLREADAKLGAALERLEDAFETSLSDDAYGCVLVKAPSRGSQDWVHIVYRDGMFWLDKWRSAKHCSREDLLNCDEREYKIALCARAREVWQACGGELRNPDRPYVREFAPRSRRPRKSGDPVGTE